MAKIEQFEPPLDELIAPIVHFLRRNGVETYESCEGGVGHSFPVPTIRFYGDRMEGHRVLGLLLAQYIPVDELRRFWAVHDGEPTGPDWEVTFHKPSLAKYLTVSRVRDAAEL